MSAIPVGISDLALYIPSPYITLDDIVRKRVSENPSFERKLRRAVEITGQKGVRYPAIWEDPASLAGNAARNLILQSSVDAWDGLRHIAVGSESAVDHSKPISAYVEGMLLESGIAIPNTLSSFQVQHACAGGTVSLLSVAALLSAAGNPGESGIVLCSDVARYDAPSTAEITQGAGAIAMRVERNPKLLELDIATVGYCSNDVDDFFRPLGSVTARVKGGYSIQCYNDALDVAFIDHAKRLGESPAEILDDTDLFVFHVPFAKMAQNAATKLLGKHGGIEGDELRGFLENRGFFSSLEASARIGNVYSGSAYLALIFLLAERYGVYGDEIEGKRLLLASYGSGNTMMVYGGRVCEGAGEVIRGWDLDRVWQDERPSTFDEYERWLGAPYDHETYNRFRQEATIPAGTFYLDGIREDGYRQYGFAR